MVGNVTALGGCIYIGQIQELRHAAHMLQACGLESSHRRRTFMRRRSSICFFLTASDTHALPPPAPSSLGSRGVRGVRPSPLGVRPSRGVRPSSLGVRPSPLGVRPSPLGVRPVRGTPVCAYLLSEWAGGWVGEREQECV